ncbi:MAG: S-layer homology domain-containing protein [Firmicutes bacterium]|nr:S-layer homology domain-containing protein [Bacillota bacterium]
MTIVNVGKPKRVSLILVLTLVLVLFAAITVSAIVQTSDTKGHWAEKQINDWRSKGLTNGYADGSFKPDKNITRAEFITLVNKAFGFTKEAEVKFTDVSAGDWFVGEIAKAKAAAYISGDPTGTVRPNQHISRQEVAAILCKILKLDSAKHDGTVDKFKDAGSIPQWSKSNIGTISVNGYMAGYPDQTFAPKNSPPEGKQ